MAVGVFVFVVLCSIIGWAIPTLTRTSALVYDPSSHQLCEVRMNFGIVEGMTCP